MAIQTMQTQAARIGKLKGDMLKHAIVKEVFTITGSHKQMPKNSSDTIIFRRALPPGGVDNVWITGANVETFAQDYQLQEGVTPTARTMKYVDVEARLQQYGVLYAITDKTFDLYEDDVAADMKQQIGETIGAIREMVTYGQLKGATNKFYAGGSSRSTVSETLSITGLRRIARGLLRNHGRSITKVLGSSGNWGTKAVEESYIVFCHTDMEPAIRALPGFVHVADYGQRRLVSECEIGTVERFRFVLSPELAPYIDAGDAVAGTGLLSTSGVNVDVYPIVLVAEEAWGNVSLRGAHSITPTWIPPGKADKADPLGQRGYAGASFYHTALVLNQGWMAVYEAGTPDLL